MADDRSTYVIDLSDEVTAPSRSIGASLARLKTQLESMRAYTERLRTLGQPFQRQDAAVRHLSTSIRRLRAEQGAINSVGGAFFEATPAIQGANEATTDFVGSLKKAGGPAGRLASGLTLLGNPLSAVIALATAGVGAFVAFAAAVVGAAVSLARLALASADARRSELLHLQGITTLRSAWGVAAGTGEELQRAIDRVSDSSALARGEIAGMAESLYRAGLRGANLSDALDGLSIAQSVQGDRGAARFRALAVSIARTGGSVRRLADDYRARLGGIAHRQALSLDRQMERLHESIGRLFGDVHIDGFLEGLNQIVSLFSQSTVTGRALRTIINATFGPLFDQVGHGAPLVVRFFQGMVLEALRVAIAIVRVRNAIAHAFGGSARSSIVGGVDALTLGRFAVLGLAAALAAVAIPLALFGLMVYGAVIRLSQFAAQVIAVRDSIAEWAASGSALVDGFIGGITSGVARVRDAVMGIAGSATSALRDALGIHSPSRVFADLGRQVPRGFSVGVDGGASDVSGATERMASSATGGAEASARIGGSAVSITIESITINGASAQAGQQAADAFVDQLARALEGLGFEVGAT